MARIFAGIARFYANLLGGVLIGLGQAVVIDAVHRFMWLSAFICVPHERVPEP
ncbi:MAG TPA: hypothetical protein VL974_03305 [Magnetospirillum sp.]|jgi:hypothetical protein|nr:hypothetical protein [Magnetospirillum sp.]